MTTSTNVHLCAERGVSLAFKINAHPRHAYHAQPWYAITLTVANERDLSFHEVAYFLTGEQLLNFADGLEKLAVEARKAADEHRKFMEHRPIPSPLSPFAQSIVRTVATATQDMMREPLGSGLPDDVEQRR